MPMPGAQAGAVSERSDRDDVCRPRGLAEPVGRLKQVGRVIGDALLDGTPGTGHPVSG